MMETDDKLIKEFMLTGKCEMNDAKFTRKVMARLPQRNGDSVFLIAVWVVAFVAFAYLFIASGAAHGLLMLIRDIFVNSFKNGTLLTDIRTFFILIIGLIVVAVQKVNSIS